MEVLYTGKQEPFIFLSDGILTQYVSHSSFSKYTINNTNEILNINKELNYLLKLFFMGNLPDSQYIYIIKLCNIFNPHITDQEKSYYEQNIMFEDFHCYDCTTRDYHKRMLEIHQKRKDFKNYLEWYKDTNELTRKVVGPDFDGHCNRARQDKIDFLRILTEVLSHIFFNLNKVESMYTVKKLLFRKLEFYFRDSELLRYDNNIMYYFSKNRIYINRFEEICFINNDLIDYLQDLYGGIYERMINIMQNYDINNYCKKQDIYSLNEIIEKYRIINNKNNGYVEFDNHQISLSQKNQIFELIDDLLKGRNQQNNLMGLN